MIANLKQTVVQGFNDSTERFFIQTGTGVIPSGNELKEYSDLSVGDKVIFDNAVLLAKALDVDVEQFVMIVTPEKCIAIQVGDELTPTCTDYDELTTEQKATFDSFNTMVENLG